MAGTIRAYQFDDRWSAQGGWLQLSIDKEVEGRDTSLNLGARLRGFFYRF